jgi:hypothetical protein
MRAQFEMHSGKSRSRLATGLVLVTVLLAPVRSGGITKSDFEMGKHWKEIGTK